MIWLSLFITSVGVLLTMAGAYIKKQMMLAETPESPGHKGALKFIDRLTEIAHGDFLRLFLMTQKILILGIFMGIFGGVTFLAAISR